QRVFRIVQRYAIFDQNNFQRQVAPRARQRLETRGQKRAVMPNKQNNRKIKFHVQRSHVVTFHHSTPLTQPARWLAMKIGARVAVLPRASAPPTRRRSTRAPLPPPTRFRHARPPPSPRAALATTLPTLRAARKYSTQSRACRTPSLRAAACQSLHTAMDTQT